jgi:hypothetical protein
LRLNSTGSVIWQKVYGGSDNDIASFIKQTSDGGYIMVGSTESFGAGIYDHWVLKLDSNGNVGPGYPGTWQKTFGGSSSEYATTIQQTADGGYIVVGETDSFGDVFGDAWVLRLNSTGSVIWQKVYGGSDNDIASFIQQTADGGYIVAGYTYSFGAGYNNAWVLKLDSSGNIEGCPIKGISTVITKQPLYSESSTNINGQPSAGNENPTYISGQDTYVSPGIVCE